MAFPNEENDQSISNFPLTFPSYVPNANADRQANRQTFEVQTNHDRRPNTESMANVSGLPEVESHFENPELCRMDRTVCGYSYLIGELTSSLTTACASIPTQTNHLSGAANLPAFLGEMRETAWQLRRAQSLYTATWALQKADRSVREWREAETGDMEEMRRIYENLNAEMEIVREAYSKCEVTLAEIDRERVLSYWGDDSIDVDKDLSRSVIRRTAFPDEEDRTYSS
ncbi:hypothetical protein M231_04042 [Tremella mesenterica]|uniref:Uncharacterized protein n=1 Tax=Tremella mesenterica TaxID=5217 RepID=A0A4Q1BM66_TREME|nr:hypothetical protein M231_04042 [Tremella mesenterica]